MGKVNYINLNPIRRGGILSSSVRKYTMKYLDGYSICDHCNGDLEKIKNPPINKIGDLLKSYYPMDKAKLTFGAREAIAMAMNAVLDDGQIVVVDQNRHYSSILAIEKLDSDFIEVESDGYPLYVIDADKYESVIRKAIEDNKNIGLIVATHVDGNFGNILDIKRIGKIASKYKIPYLINAAYSAGRFAFDPSEAGADFVAISGHKSFGSSGPIGALLYQNKWHKKTTRKSEIYKNKKVDSLGCGVRGTAAASFYKALTELDNRLDMWNEELDKTKYFIREMRNISKGGIYQLGEQPKKHDLVQFETPLLYEISQKHRKRGYFLASKLKKHDIVGIKHGRTKRIKVSVYGLTHKEIDYVINIFKQIINEH